MQQSQRETVQALLREKGIMRLTELLEAGVTAATLSRMKRNGEVRHLARGLYQLADADLELHHDMAEVAKRVPKGVVCLVSALAFHELTLDMPAKMWIAIGRKDWAPKIDRIAIRCVRFADSLLQEGYETHSIEGVAVKVFSVSRTVVDCFRHRSKVGLALAIEGLQEALRQKRATPGEIAEQAMALGAYTLVKPYLEALTANG